ncbi:uncharacterized protein LOC126842650 [Adelges cooleyi]|uniref:uncharacterized protein LOC126842650 n=1 Tax=Adelges cooleyi TaxID=133065 RepID=UPI00218094A9|nr:uncharacterized protein LOC126842650 [Adelges cooleyi]
MGGSASTTSRTLEIENPNVVNISEKVVDRLRGQAQGVNAEAIGVPTYQIQPSTLQIQKSVQEALEENDKRWEQRFRHVHQEQNALSRKIENEYKRAYISVKELLPEIGDGVLSQGVQKKEQDLLECLAKNKGSPLNCNDTVKEYQKTLFQTSSNQTL